MKIITMSKVGYNHPSQANWSYRIWKIDLINTKEKYNMSHTVKENFGGDERLKRELEALKIPILETKGIYTNTGTPKITGVAGLQSMESKEFIKEIIDWYKKK